MFQGIDMVEVSGTTTINDLLNQLVVKISEQVTKNVLAGLASASSKSETVPPIPESVEAQAAPVEPLIEKQELPGEIVAEITLPAEPKVKGKRQLSPEAKRKISEAQKARWAARDSRTLTPEAKEKISASQKARWARLKGTPEVVPTLPLPADDDTGVDSPQLTRELVVEAEEETEVLPIAATPVESLPVATREGYTGDVFYIHPDGHFVGVDGFIVPQNFAEFLDRFPNYITGWAKKRLFGKASPEDIEDWTQELGMHMGSLPPKSKYRAEGLVDVVQTFNPFQQYGASERRFRYYINYCLTNKFNTVHGKRMKNPVCRMGNLSLSNADDSMQEMYSNGEATDEYIYANSKYMVTASNKAEKNAQDKVFTEKFIEYVAVHDPQVVEVLKAIHISGSTSDILQYFCSTCNRMATTLELTEGAHTDHTMGLNAQEFQRAKSRLKQLANCFSNNVEPPKARKAYKKREKAAVA